MNTSARYLSNRHRPALKAICTIALAVGMTLSGLAASVGEGLPLRGVCAHRGANSTHPENTLAAFREAIRQGAHMIELDVALTRDRQMVLMHDATVDRTTDGSGKVADLTLAEIRALDAGSKQGAAFAGERVPTFAEALAIMPTNIWLNVHLKSGRLLAEQAALEIARQNRLHQAFLAARREGALAARAVCPQIMICNMERRKSRAQYVSETIEHKDQFLQLVGGPGTAEEMARLKAAGVRINCFMGGRRPKTEEEMLKLLDAGVDFPLVDYLAPMMEAAAKRDIKPLKCLP